MINKVSNDFFWMSAPLKIASISIGGKMTGFRLNDGSLALVSPFKFSKEQKTEIDKLGKVSMIIAPNLFHHLFLQHALNEYPEAKLVATPGLAEKRKDLKIDHILTNNVPLPEWKGLVSQTLVGGMPRYNEVVFIHHPTRTLIATDLIFNVQKHKGWKEVLFWKLNRAYKKATPTALFKMLIKDRRLVRQSVESILTWDFDRVVMAHGEVIEKNAKKIFQEGFTWLVKH